MPEDLEPAQAAWVELVALVKDPGFAAASRRYTTHLWEALRERGIEAAWWHERHAEIGTRAAIERGLGPESDEVQGIVADYVTLYARAMGERPTGGFARRLAEMVSGWVESVDPKTRRFWELLARLDVEDLISSQASVNELILESLRRRAGA